MHLQPKADHHVNPQAFEFPLTYADNHCLGDISTIALIPAHSWKETVKTRQVFSFQSAPGPMISVPAPPPTRSMMMGGPRQGGTPPLRLATASFLPVRPDDTVKSGEAFIPPMERGIDMSSGGEAGMAGVGRMFNVSVSSPPTDLTGPQRLTTSTP
jgi:hypothetical protein